MAEPGIPDNPLDLDVGRYIAATNAAARAESRRNQDAIILADRKRRLEEELERVAREEERVAREAAERAPEVAPSVASPASDGAFETPADESDGGDEVGEGLGDGDYDEVDEGDLPDDPFDDLPDGLPDDLPDDGPDGPSADGFEEPAEEPADDVEGPVEAPDDPVHVEEDGDGAVEAPESPQMGDGALSGQGEPPVSDGASRGDEAPRAADVPGRVPRVAERFPPMEKATGGRRDAVYGIQPKDPLSGELKRTRLKEVPAGLPQAMRADIIASLPPRGEGVDGARALLSEMRYADILVLWVYLHAGASFGDWMRANGLLSPEVERIASVVPGEHRADGVRDAVADEIDQLARHVRALESDVKVVKVATALSAADAMGVTDAPTANVTSFADVPLPLMGSIAQDSLLRLLEMAPGVLSATRQRLAGSAGDYNAAKFRGDV